LRFLSQIKKRMLWFFIDDNIEISIKCLKLFLLSFWYLTSIFNQSHLKICTLIKKIMN
jgi:hypothetical protein